MSPSATPATQKCSRRHDVRPRRAQASPSAPPRWMPSCPTPATQNDGRCEIVPRLPREIKVDVTKCHACHAEVARRHGVTAAPKPVQARHPVPSVPRLPRKTTVDVRLCHACHVKSRWMSPSATPATQKWRHAASQRDQGGAQASPSAPPRAICPTPATQNDGRCEFVPRLPREIKVDVTKCHACHACLPRKTTVDVRLRHACHVKSRWMSPSATPATQKSRGVTGVTAAPKPVQARHPVPSVPRLPRKTTVDVRLCHACHVKSRWMSPSATPATPATQK